MAYTNNTLVHEDARRGRGSVSRASGRFEKYTAEAFDDGWGTLDDAPPPLRTEVLPDTARKIITYNTSPDIGFDRSINPYRGCEHGCVYCFARPTHSYLGLSAGLDFESRLFAKFDAPELLEKELSHPRYVPKTAALGINTDSYQPIERDYEITRRILQVVNRFGQPVSIVTKSQLIQRDLDVLSDMARRRLISVAVSLTTLDRGLARRMEPRAATPARRLDTMKALSDAGVPVTLMMAPIIPAINDMEMEAIYEQAAKAGAGRVGYVVLRLPHEIKDLFREWLAEHYPDRAHKVMHLLQSMRGGRDYDAAYFTRQRGQGVYADLIAARHQKAMRRFGLNRKNHTGDVSHFKVPTELKSQLNLFED